MLDYRTYGCALSKQSSKKQIVTSKIKCELLVDSLAIKENLPIHPGTNPHHAAGYTVCRRTREWDVARHKCGSAARNKAPQGTLRRPWRFVLHIPPGTLQDVEIIAPVTPALTTDYVSHLTVFKKNGHPFKSSKGAESSTQSASGMIPPARKMPTRRLT